MAPTAKAVLLHLWKRHNGSNNGDIVYAVRDAGEIGVGKSNAAAALALLIERGFLQVRRNSAFNVKTKEARTWTVTAEPINGKPATRDFMYRSPPQSGPPDRKTVRKSKTQSGPPDTQSGPPDRKAQIEIILPVSVRRAGPSEAFLTTSQSGPPDTSNIPYVPVRFGDAAKATRTRRSAPAQAEARGGLTANESEAAPRAERRIDDNYEEDGGRGLTRLDDVIARVIAGASGR